MSAFAWQKLNLMKGVISSLHRRVDAHTRLYLSNDEALQLFIPEAERETFRQFSRSIDVGQGKSFTFSWPHSDLRLQCTCYHRGEYVFPPLANARVQDDANPEIVERVTSWVKSGVDTGRDFGRVLALLDKLNAKYSAAMIRFYWPTILAICNEHDELKDVADKLQDVRPPARQGVGLPPDLVAACRATATTIAVARLMPETPASSSAPSPEIIMKARAGYFVEEPGLGQFYCPTV